MVELLINLQRPNWNQENSKLLDRTNVQDRIDLNPAPNVLSVLDTISTLPRKISNVKPLDIISREFWKFLSISDKKTRPIQGRVWGMEWLLYILLTVNTPFENDSQFYSNIPRSESKIKSLYFSFSTHYFHNSADFSNSLIRHFFGDSLFFFVRHFSL